MSHVVSFSIDGLAGRKTTYARKLHRDINVFFGLNGTGKTSLLRILDSAMNGDASLLKNVPFKEAFVSIYSITHDREFEYSIKAEERPRDLTLRTIEYQDVHYWKALSEGIVLSEAPSYRWKVKPETETKRWQHRFLPATRLLQRSRRGMHEPIKSEEEFDIHFESALQEHWSEFFGEIQASVRKSQQDGLADILNAVLNADDLAKEKQGLKTEVAYEQVVSFLKRQDPPAHIPQLQSFSSRFETSGLLRHVVARIDRVENEIDAAMLPRTQLDRLAKSISYESFLKLLEQRTQAY